MERKEVVISAENRGVFIGLKRIQIWAPKFEFSSVPRVLGGATAWLSGAGRCHRLALGCWAVPPPGSRVLGGATAWLSGAGRCHRLALGCWAVPPPGSRVLGGATAWLSGAGRCHRLALGCWAVPPPGSRVLGGATAWLSGAGRCHRLALGCWAVPPPGSRVLGGATAWLSGAGRCHRLALGCWAVPPPGSRVLGGATAWLSVLHPSYNLLQVVHPFTKIPMERKERGKLTIFSSLDCWAKTSYRGLNLFSKLYVRSTGWQMIYVSSQPASFVRNVILSHKVFFEKFQMTGFLLNAATLSGWDHPKLIRVAKVASNLDLLMVMTVKSA
ncbi:hypothetical protein C4D60_Mb10t01100 [Musa balbisiana]|uniref:Uncharacterized protein n=1 Tax=Musa balbisiana TaxID=52838 RepID=A0A4S8IV52_MUSBA|nr:hypothetical protein C4D60_Mb10t01100 [Musa balbisiana]